MPLYCELPPLDVAVRAIPAHQLHGEFRDIVHARTAKRPAFNALVSAPELHLIFA
jgi:hypothetical protein